MVDQLEFYSGHNQKFGYKYQSIVTPDSLVSSLMGSFISWRGDWKMVKLSGLESKLREVNAGWILVQALFLYSDLAYCTVYGIMGSYKNYLSQPCTPAEDQFNKMMAKF